MPDDRPSADEPLPFELHIPETEIAALRARIANVRWPDEPPGPAWATGTSLDHMRDLAGYWMRDFEWRSIERRINMLRQFSARVDGCDLHFIHLEGKGPAPFPLLLCHGWPGSIVEFLDLVPLLADPAAYGGDPADAFTVVAPSLPGYTLSYRPGMRRLDPLEMASCFRTLMVDVLGHARFGAQGGDWGAYICALLGRGWPDDLAGIHLNLLPIPRDLQPRADATQEERAYLDEARRFAAEDSGYQWIQATRPQTLAYSLNDSPVGLAAWMVEKFRGWTDPRTDFETALGRDRMLANICLYWFTGSVGASFWPYYARGKMSRPLGPLHPVGVPTGYAEFPYEILRPPRSMAARTFTDIRRWSRMDRGGHFAAWENPRALADEIRAFFRPLRGIGPDSGGASAARQST